MAWILSEISENIRISLSSGNLHLLFYDTSVAYRKGDESVVKRAEEDDGPYHHTTDEAEGPAGSQDSVDLGNKDWAQCPRPTPRSRQPPHVHTLQEATANVHVNVKIKPITSAL